MPTNEAPESVSKLADAPVYFHRQLSNDPELDAKVNTLNEEIAKRMAEAGSIQANIAMDPPTPGGRYNPVPMSRVLDTPYGELRHREIAYIINTLRDLVKYYAAENTAKEANLQRFRANAMRDQADMLDRNAQEIREGRRNV